MAEYVYDPSIVIFEVLYQLRVPNVYAVNRSAGYINTVGDEDTDKQHLLKHVVVMWNIADIAEHQFNGRPYNLIKRHDIQRMYNNIRDYLEAWYVEMNRTGIHKTIGPYEDLIKLDSLAKHLFDSYKIHLDQGYTSSDEEMETKTVQQTLNAIFYRKNIAERQNLEYDDKYTKAFTRRMFNKDNGSVDSEHIKKSFKKEYSEHNE